MTTTPVKTTYTCRPPSLAHSVITFFVDNQDEALTAQDLVTKWGAKANSLGTLLAQAHSCGAITHNGGLYMLGNLDTARQCIAPALAAEPLPQAPAPAPAPAAEPTTARSPDDAPENQQINVHGVGDLFISYELLASRAPTVGRKWDPVMEKLSTMPIDIETRTRPTIRIPRQLAGAARAGASSWIQRNIDRRVSIRVISVGTDSFIQRVS